MNTSAVENGFEDNGFAAFEGLQSAHSFEDVSVGETVIPIGGEDFFGGRKFDNALNQAKKGDAFDVKQMLKDVVNNYQKSVSTAKVKNNNILLERAKEFGKKLLKSLWDYTIKALEMAMHKFALELFAMAIAGIMAAWSANPNHKPMDISSGGVYVGQQQTTVASNAFGKPTQSTLGSDPWNNNNGWGSMQPF